jgi:hypothetical protein
VTGVGRKRGLCLSSGQCGYGSWWRPYAGASDQLIKLDQRHCNIFVRDSD